MVRLEDVSVLQRGKGKDLLFLHGYLSCKEAFRGQIDYFAKFYRVTALDFVGFGRSVPLASAFSVGDYANWLCEVMALLRLKKPSVIAHSFGCRVAVKAAAENAALFDKLILTGPAGIVEKRGWKYRLQVGGYRVVKKFAPRFAERRFGSAEYRTLNPVMKESYKKIVNEDLRGAAARVRNSVLIVQGNEDTVTPLCSAQTYLAAFPRACLRMISGGHFAFAEEALTFNLLAEEFLYGTLDSWHSCRGDGDSVLRIHPKDGGGDATGRL